jgi:hypothetical protein
MNSYRTDTHPETEVLQFKLLQQVSALRKMEMLAELNASARTLTLVGLRAQYPQAQEQELHRKLADLLLGERLAFKVYGDEFDAT